MSKKNKDDEVLKEWQDAVFPHALTSEEIDYILDWIACGKADLEKLMKHQRFHDELKKIVGDDE